MHGCSCRHEEVQEVVKLCSDMNFLATIENLFILQTRMLLSRFDIGSPARTNG
jgi:hypothetical protein